ncbi:hypothetical protein QE152_g40513, partial [Popillia japonica]
RLYSSDEDENTELFARPPLIKKFKAFPSALTNIPTSEEIEGKSLASSSLSTVTLKSVCTDKTGFEEESKKYFHMIVK